MPYADAKAFKDAIKWEFVKYEEDKFFIPSFFTNVKEERLAWKTINNLSNKTEILSELIQLYKILLNKKSEKLALAVALIIAEEKNIPERLVRQYHLLRFEKLHELPAEGLCFFEFLTEDSEEYGFSDEIVGGKLGWSRGDCWVDSDMPHPAARRPRLDLETLKTQMQEVMEKPEQENNQEKKEDIIENGNHMIKKNGRWFLRFFTGCDCRATTSVEFSMGFIEGENAKNAYNKLETEFDEVVGCNKEWSIKIEDPILWAENQSVRRGVII